MNKAVLAFLSPALLVSLAHGQDASRSYAAELLNDASTRASYQATGGAGHDANGFGITDGSGANALYLGGATQFRYTMNFRDEDVGDNSDFTHGFNAPNNRIWAWGHVWDKSLTYTSRCGPATRASGPSKTPGPNTRSTTASPSAGAR